MRLLVDCAPLSVGGGVQVAIAFLLNLQVRPDIKWLAVLSEQVRTAVGPALAADPRIVFVRKQSLTDFAVLNRRLAAIEKAFAPDVVFTVFGPTYFRTGAPNLMGFALPHLIYDGDCPQTKRSVRDRAADQARTFLLRRADQDRKSVV